MEVGSITADFLSYGSINALKRKKDWWVVLSHVKRQITRDLHFVES
jgi:hypothetical protein